eukprot:8962770-Prorocentrum_lima.AAC.1
MCIRDRETSWHEVPGLPATFVFYDAGRLAGRDGAFDFTGRHVVQHNDFSVEVDQNEYWANAAPIPLARARRAQSNDNCEV